MRRSSHRRSRDSATVCRRKMNGHLAIRVVDGTISLKRSNAKMKWIRMFSAAFALAGMIASTNAGLHGSGGCKSCGCAEECQPACCKPTIARPCHTNVYTYQRKCSDIKPPCCDNCCAPQALLCIQAGCGNGNGNGCCNGWAPMAAVNGRQTAAVHGCGNAAAAAAMCYLRAADPASCSPVGSAVAW